MLFEHKVDDSLRLLITDKDDFLILLAFDQDGNNFDWFFDLDQAQLLATKAEAVLDGSHQWIDELFEATADDVDESEIHLHFVRRGDIVLDVYGRDKNGTFATELTIPLAEWNKLIEQLLDLVDPPREDFVVPDHWDFEIP